jgi:drug/metabolite transporter (DMT)-like permease
VSGDHHPETTRGAIYGLLGAALFGASTPIAKLLLGSTGPVVLAGLLYLGGGAAVSVAAAFRQAPEARLRGKDWPLMAGVVLAGGFAGPALMMWGLTRVSALASALLLNLEAPFTLLLALTLFREHLGLRALGAAAAIVLGGALLGVRPGELHADPLGVAALAGACACWGLDNNLTQRLSVRDPLAIVRVKALAAGMCNLALGWAVGQRLPGGGALAGALALGAVSFGASIVLDVLALRHLGAAREAALFATAPFAGALLAIPLVGERPTAVDFSAMALLAIGVAALTREKHSHRHSHEPLEHEHLHIHDAHHQHPHQGPVTEPHSHLHRHGALTHEHPHASDAHHRHSH